MRGYQATLTNGQVISEQDKSWLDLKQFLLDKKLRVSELILLFDNQKIFVRKFAPTYFYAKRLSAWLDVDIKPKHMYGIGAEEKPGYVEITWYDGDNSEIELREIKKDDKGILFNNA